MELAEVIVGRVAKAHGIRGEVSIDVRTDEPDERFAAGRSMRDEKTKRRLTVQSSRWHGDRLLVRFDGVDDRNEAESLQGMILVIDVDPAVSPADPEEYYDRQLIGLDVLDATGTSVGAVVAVHHHELQDALIVQVPGSGERLIPFTSRVVPTVDLAAGTCQLADIPGLIEDLD